MVQAEAVTDLFADNVQSWPVVLRDAGVGRIDVSVDPAAHLGGDPPVAVGPPPRAVSPLLRIEDLDFYVLATVHVRTLDIRGFNVMDIVVVKGLMRLGRQIALIEDYGRIRPYLEVLVIVVPVLS
ncbi:MAG TPA: hypothetical protein VHL78_00500 [Actinomycetota bacterium]|nr:hypothetical protein [Actinomycetota bacterium]